MFLKKQGQAFDEISGSLSAHAKIHDRQLQSLEGGVVLAATEDAET